jgi:hypothetical protein
MSLEHICAVEALLGRAARAWAETTYHGSFVVRQCVPVLVVLARETLGVVFASRDRTFLWALVLVCEHVRLEILEVPATCGVWAEAFVGFVG